MGAWTTATIVASDAVTMANGTTLLGRVEWRRLRRERADVSLYETTDATGQRWLKEIDHYSRATRYRRA